MWYSVKVHPTLDIGPNMSAETYTLSRSVYEINAVHVLRRRSSPIWGKGGVRGLAVVPVRARRIRHSLSAEADTYLSLRLQANRHKSVARSASPNL